MKARVQKWGHSLAVRIPKAFAGDLGLEAGAEVELTLDDGALTLRPAPQAGYRLEDLIEGVTRSNVHGEEEGGAPAGREEW